jgi:hypothetical protein
VSSSQDRTPAEFAELAGGEAFEVVRLESVAERIASTDVSVEDFLTSVETHLRDAVTVGAVGLKSVVAYRTGLELPAEPPTDVEVTAAASAWLRWNGQRLDDPILLAWLVHLGARLSAELHVPLQLHTGFGDDDIRLHRADPALLGDFLRATKSTGATIALLHTWPFHRHAGYLAHLFGLLLVRRLRPARAAPPLRGALAAGARAAGRRLDRRRRHDRRRRRTRRPQPFRRQLLPGVRSA